MCNGLSYIVAIRMRRSKALGELILSRAGRYREVEGNLRVKEVKVAEEGDRYILCYNPYRAEEDRKAREAIVAQLKEKISSGNVRRLLRGTARRYVRTGGGKVELDRRKVAEDARYDGKWLSSGHEMGHPLRPT